MLSIYNRSNNAQCIVLKTDVESRVNKKRKAKRE